MSQALRLSALDETARPSVPFHYALDRLAQRWSTRPDLLEEMDTDWLIRGLEYQRMEASVKVKRG